MIWALLAILGVPIWLVVGALCGALLSRRRFASQPGAFLCRVRADGGKWGRASRHARWVHDVLLVAGGPARLQIRPLGITELVQGPHDSDARFRGSDTAIAITVGTDDDTQVEIAAPSAATQLLLGPFAAGD